MAISSAGTSISAATRKKPRPVNFLDRDLVGGEGPPPDGAAPHCPAARADTLGRTGGHAVLVDEHQRRDELTLRVQQVHLRRRRDHVAQDVARAGGELVYQLDGALAIATHLFASLRLVKRTASFPSSIAAPDASARAGSLRILD